MTGVHRQQLRLRGGHGRLSVLKAVGASDPQGNLPATEAGRGPMDPALIAFSLQPIRPCKRLTASKH